MLVAPAHYLHISIINVTESSKCIMTEEIPAVLLSRNIRKEEIVGRHIISDLRRINRPRPIWWLLFSRSKQYFGVRMRYRARR